MCLERARARAEQDWAMRQATDTATLAPPPADDAEMTDEEPVNDAVKAEPVEPVKSKRKRRTKSGPGKKVPHRKPRAVAAAKKIGEPTKTAPPEFADYSEVPTYNGITWYPSADGGCEGRTHGRNGLRLHMSSFCWREPLWWAT